MRTLSDDIKKVFSVLPKPYASEASVEFLRSCQNTDPLMDLRLKWGDYDRKGRFLKGGILDIRASSLHFVNNADGDSDLSQISEEIEAVGAIPGNISGTPCLDRLVWQIPLPATAHSRHPKVFVRALIIPFELFSDIVSDYNENAVLAGSEIRIAFQILMGLTVRDAASLDQVSVETKRTQLKSVCSKLQCRGQKELVAFLVGHLAHLVSLCDVESKEVEAIQAFAGEFLDPGARINLYSLSNGRALRTIETGPKDGKPVIVMHSMMYPLFIAGASTYADAAGIRLITPIRRGYLEGGSMFSLLDQHDLAEQTLADLSVFLEDSDYPPVPVLGQSFGGTLAIKFAAEHPSLVSEIYIVSIMFDHGGKPPKGFFGKWSEGLRGIAMQPDLLRLISWQFMKYYRVRKTTRETLLRMFGGNPSDRLAFERPNSENSTYDMFKAFHRNSYIGFADDVRQYGIERFPKLTKDVPAVHFIHGESDPLTPLEKVRSLLRPKEGDLLHVIPKAGQFSYASHQKEVWTELIEKFVA